MVLDELYRYLLSITNFFESFGGNTVWVFGIFVVGILVLSLISEQIRTRHMEAFARELHCRFIRRRPGRRVPDEDERNVIEGVWRGQPVLIYDLHIQEGEDSSRRTVINGRFYTGPLFTYLPIKKIRRVLAGDPAMIAKVMPDATLPSLTPQLDGKSIRAVMPYVARVAAIGFVIIFLTSIVFIVFFNIFYAP